MPSKSPTDARLFYVLPLTLGLAGCAPEPVSNGAIDAGVDAPATSSCPEAFHGDVVKLTAHARVESGQEVSYCRRYTTPEPLAIRQFVGTLGPAGHHSLLLVHSPGTEPDGLAPCSEAEIMDAQAGVSFQLLGGASYETDGVPLVFPASPVQVGLRVPAGAQLIFDAHFLNPSPNAVDACASMELSRATNLGVALEFRTVLPKSQFALTVPAHQTITASYDDEPATSKVRIVAASSHLHEGGKHLRMSIVETGQTVYETTTWVEPKPTLYDKTILVLDKGQTIRIECTLENTTAMPQSFPTQMCVGAMYVMPW